MKVQKQLKLLGLEGSKHCLVIIYWHFRIEALVVLIVKEKGLVDISQIGFNFYSPHNFRIKYIFKLSIVFQNLHLIIIQKVGSLKTD